MNTTSHFTSDFWNYYIIGIVLLSFIGLIWLLLSQNKVKPLKKGEDVNTTGHNWDGIEEYNNPMPRWWFFLYIGTWLFGIGYLVMYPGLGDFGGIGFGGKKWTSIEQYREEVAQAEQSYKPLYDKYAKMPVEQVAKDPAAQKIGKNLFDTYCIQCHGSDAKGARGFPNLTDSDWLFGGTPEKIHETIVKGRTGVMASWGPKLGEERVKDVAHYVMSLSKPAEQYDAVRAERGKELFNGPPAKCFTCHGDKGQGVRGFGPNLTDDVWLWGGTQKAIIETITNGRHNQMPAWEGFLDKDKIHLLTAYVWGLSHKDGKAQKTDTENVLGSKAAAAAEAAAAEKKKADAEAAAKAASEAAAKETAASAPAADKPAEAAAGKPAEAAAPAAAADGKKVFDGLCFGCHGANSAIPNTPRLTHKDEWAPRIKKGKETLFKHAIEGFQDKGMMPAKGGNTELSDDEVKAAVIYMVNESGGKF